MRSRNVSVSIIIQNIAQLKALFEKQWESIIGNCDEFLYLGGNEQSTHKYVSELLGKETIDTNTFGRTRGNNGNYSTNWQLSGRELLTADEVRLLDNQIALLFIRGERAVQDAKFDILHHPNVKATTDGGASVYRHGLAHGFAGELELKPVYTATDAIDIEPDKDENAYTLLTEEEVEELYSAVTPKTKPTNKE
jgi:type IV secretion system protein VirD4